MVAIDPFASFAQGASLRRDVNQQRANVQAAQGVAGGNYAQALGALGGVGDIGGVIQVQNAQNQAETARRSRQEADLGRQVAFSRQATGALKQAIASGQDPLVAFDGLVPAFQALGATPEQVQTYRQSLAANPTGFVQQIEQLTNSAARQLEIQNLGNGYGVAIDKTTGQVVNEYQAPQRPVNVGNVLIDPSTREVILDAREPRYQTIQNTDGSSSLVAIDQPAPVTSGGGQNVDVLGAIQSVIPGVTFNSGTRTPQQNRDAGGAQNSYHLRGQAVDIPPQRGTSPDQLRAQLQAQGVNVRELIDEGDHWHIAWGNSQQAPNFGRGAPQPRVVAQGQDRGLSPAQERQERRLDMAEENSSRRDEVGLRREFNARQEVKDFRTIEAAYRNVQSAAANPSAAGDLSLIFAYMKILDPGSVVREQEFANAQNAAGVPDRVRNLYNRALNGQRLNPNQRQDFVNQANGLYRSRLQTYDTLANEYRGYAESYGVSPDRVAPREQRQQSNAPRTNAPGLRFDISQPQLATRQRLIQQGASSSQPLGSARNPYYINPANATTSFANVRRGAYFVTPDGQVRGPKP